jgi:transposase
MDVHKVDIVATILRPGDVPAIDGIRIANTAREIAKLVKRAGREAEYVYEAGPCGYEVQRQVEELGAKCHVVAPALTPVRPGDRVKTDKRDARKLARLWRAGELTAIRVPSREEEAARDVVREREDELEDRLRARHRLGGFLLRQGRVWRETKAWGVKHREWLKRQEFGIPALQATFEAYMRGYEEAEARLVEASAKVEDMAGEGCFRPYMAGMRCLKGVDTLTAMTLVAEAQDFRRFRTASAFMCFAGLVGREDSSGDAIRRGGITKAGNAHIRRVLIEAAWQYRRQNVTGVRLAERRKECGDEGIRRYAQAAQDRLHRKFWRMISRGKDSRVAAVAVARELAGFVWGVGNMVAAGGEA